MACPPEVAEYYMVTQWFAGDYAKYLSTPEHMIRRWQFIANKEAEAKEARSRG